MKEKNENGLVIRFTNPFPADVAPVALNVEEMKKAATSWTEKFKGLVVTPETWAACKDSAAEQKKAIDALTAAKTALRKKAGELVAKAISDIDEVLAIITPNYNNLHAALAAAKEGAEKEKVDAIKAKADEICAAQFPELTAAKEHLHRFVDAKCAEKRGGWLTKTWTVDACATALHEEAQRMGKAMGFINAHVKGKPVDVVRVAKTALVNNAFNEVLALEAMDKYERTLVEQKRMDDVRAGRDPDRKPEPRPVAVSDPIPPKGDKNMTATVRFTATLEAMKQLVAVIKASGVQYEVLEQKFI